ncbi:MAG: hypothetical protein AAGB05_17830 [Pseudomonadota bacterium]
MDRTQRTIPFSRVGAAALALILGATVAHGAQLSCRSGGVSLDVSVDPSAGTCAIDGQRAALRKPHNPVVCHVANPQLKILTIGTDGSFTWEETDTARVTQGTCSRG